VTAIRLFSIQKAGKVAGFRGELGALNLSRQSQLEELLGASAAANAVCLAMAFLVGQDFMPRASAIKERMESLPMVNATAVTVLGGVSARRQRVISIAIT
jgi:hypothetical protein